MSGPTENDSLFADELPPPESSRETSAAPRAARGRSRAPRAEGAAAFNLFAEIAVAEPVAQAFSYGVPGGAMRDDVVPGALVEVPFAGRTTRGVVLSLSDAPPADVPAAKIRALRRVLTPGYTIPGELVRLARWMADYYYCSLGDALQAVSFLGINDIAHKSTTHYTLAAGATAAPEENASTEPRAPRKGDGPANEHESADASEENASTEPRAPRKGDGPAGRITAKQRVVLDALARSGEAMSLAEISEVTGASAAVVQNLAKRGDIVAARQIVERRDEYSHEVEPDSPLAVNDEQAAAIARINAAIDAGVRGAASTAKANASVEARGYFLLHGVTGSGKTEVYLQAIAHALSLGRQAIVLVPEIALTPQTVDRFRRRFGAQVGVYHSRLTLGQKHDLWRRVDDGRCTIMIGARSALFTPFRDLGIVVIDEEHETSYKQDSTPRYNARHVAMMRTRSAGAALVLGSATPSIDSYHLATQGRIELIELRQRIDDRPMPAVEIIDMTREVRDGQNTDLFSDALRKAIDEALARGEQVVLLLNRRGFHNFLVCMDCHADTRCDHCDAPLTFHKGLNRLMCHYCNRQYAVPKTCAKCESDQLMMIGTGTQRLEERVAELWPDVASLRMDVDTTRQRGALLDAWRRIESGEVRIILGTQMIAKGLHLENVTVVGVPLADVSLFQPDFRSAERAFSLLTQVAGRAGRGSLPGRVLIQTYVPQHYAIQFARTHDYIGFYKKELRVRQVLRFPPHHRLVSVLTQGPDAQKTAELTQDLARAIREAAFNRRDVTVLGPAPAPIARLNDLYRWRLLLRSQEHRLLKAVLHKGLRVFEEIPGHSALQIAVDIDPLDLM